MSIINGISNVDQNYVNTTKTNKNNQTNNASFSTYLGESKDMNDIFERAAKKYNVPVNLLKAIGKAESNFNDKAVSKAGAQGVMQLMPATARSLGVTDSFDAEQNIMGGAKYISQLLKKYDGNTNLALAAYNAGMGNVAKYGGIPPFKETQNYVVKVNKFLSEGVGNIPSTKPMKAVEQSYTMVPAVPLETEETQNISQEMDEIFSYELYLKFIEKYLNYNIEEKEKENSISSYNNSKNINYHVPLMNINKIQIPKS